MSTLQRPYMRMMGVVGRRSENVPQCGIVIVVKTCAAVFARNNKFFLLLGVRGGALIIALQKIVRHDILQYL